jgi:hypothetical protein
MGRVTYEKFYANWGHIAGNPYIDLINAMPKYDPICVVPSLDYQRAPTTQSGGSVCGYQDLREELTAR